MATKIDYTKIKDNIITARVGLLLHHPFFGNLATRLQIKEGGEWCKTAATDGRHIFYNAEFFQSLDIKQIQFVLAHEIMHNVFDHMTRRETRNPKLFNIAGDYCVNGQLVRDNIGDHNLPNIKIFHDQKYYGMGAEQIYDILKEENDENLENSGELVDQHIDWTEQPTDGDGSNGSGRPVYSEAEWREISDTMREAVLAAAQAVGAGNVPASVQRMIKEFTEPKMNWREVLRQQIQSVIKDDYTWMRPNRKSWHLSAILPGTNVRDTIDVCIALDMSGSIGDDQARDFLGEVKGIMQEFKDFKIKIWCFDTEIYNCQDFDAYNIDEFDDYQPIGGGGTDFEANWEFMKDNEISPKKFIMFTDMYPCGSWGDETYCDTLFIGHGTTTIVPPFGEYAYYEFATATA